MKLLEKQREKDYSNSSKVKTTSKSKIIIPKNTKKNELRI